MKKTRRNILLALSFALLLGLGFTSLGNKDMELVKNLDIYYTLFRELNMFYVDETDPKELVTTSIDAMLASLDPYTTYVPESKADDFNFQTTGEYGGIGSLIRRSGEYTMIAEPYEGFPAQKAGLRAGDKIVKIDEHQMEGKDIEAVSSKLKGTPGTEIIITVERYGEEEPLELGLVREKISVPNVPYYGMLNQETAYIRLSDFKTGSAAEVESALRNLKSEQQLSSLVLDLRSNPGGILGEAVKICNLFVDKGELIVKTRGKMTQWDKDYITQNRPMDKELPLVILINRGSASASEIVAGAMQDLDRAVIVGQRTFGKGLVQIFRPLKYNAQLKLTAAKYYIPSGRCIQALDYTNRNEDGSVGTIPDSLVSEYETRNGRLVYDGGGVQPDIESTGEEISEITIQLFTQNVFFDFATRYRANHESISLPETFTLSDDEYLSFKSFVEDQDFEFKTASEKAFDQLVKTAKREQYYSVAEEELLSLEEKLSHNNLKDLETFQDEIREILSEEIANRYYYQKGRIVSQIRNDLQLEKALEILNEPGTMKEVLAGNQGALVRANQEI